MKTVRIRSLQAKLALRLTALYVAATALERLTKRLNR